MGAIGNIANMINSALKETADIVTEKIEIEYENVIDIFYEDYTPKFYDRTQSIYYASDHFSGAAPQGNFVAGILANTSISDFYNTKVFGKSEKINGGFISGITVSSDNISYHPYKANTDWVFDRAYSEGKHGYNNSEADAWGLRHSKNLHMMRPTPYKLMDSKVKKINKEIDNIFDKSLSKYWS